MCGKKQQRLNNMKTWGNPGISLLENLMNDPVTVKSLPILEATDFPPK